MADEFRVLNILSAEFIKKISPRFRALSPELEREFLVCIEHNLQGLFSQNFSIAVLQRNLQSYFSVFTAIIDILERIATETGISLKAQLPFVIPSIFKRLKVGEGGFTPATVETLIRELFRKVRIFEEVIREQKINVREMSLSIPKISQMIDETPLEGFREAIKPVLLQAEQHRMKTLKTVLTNPRTIPVYGFLPNLNSYALQEVVQESPQLALAPPLNAKLNSRQPPIAMVYNSYKRRNVPAIRQPPPVVTRYRMVRAENLPSGANPPPAELAAEQQLAKRVYNLGVHASFSPGGREREFKLTLQKGNVPNCIGILNMGLNPNSLTFNPLELICSRGVPSAARLELILALCSPSAEDAPGLRIPNTTSELVTTSEYSFLDNLFKRVFYKFTADDKSICTTCINSLEEDEAAAAIRQIARLPMHLDGSPYLAVVEQIRGKLEQTVGTIRGRIDKFIDLLPQFHSARDAKVELEAERAFNIDDTERSVPPGSRAWLRTQNRWQEVVITSKIPDEQQWIVADPNSGDPLAVEYLGLRVPGTPVWLRVNDTWKEMVIAGGLNEGLWAVRPPVPPGAAEPVSVPYTDLKLRAEDSLQRNHIYTKLNKDLLRISELIGIANRFIEGVKLDYASVGGETALLRACDKDSATLVSALAEVGADINLQTGSYLVTPLIKSVKNGNTEVVQVLCSNPAIRTDLRDSLQRSPLYYALSTVESYTRGPIPEEDRLTILQALIGAGADPHERFGDTGETALNIAAQHHSRAYFQYLLDLPLDPNESSGQGVTPLMRAASRGDIDIISLLLERGANIDALDRRGENALFYSLINMAVVERGNALSAVKYLVQKGIDFRQRNSDGLTIYNWAKANFATNQRQAGYRVDPNILPYLAKLFGCVGGICRAVGIEGLGPNANTRRRRGAAAAAAPAALTAVAPFGGSRRKRRTKRRGRRRSRSSR